ncbi:MAG: nucleotidyltransferase family protein [Flavisolibacter sp.]
MSELQNGQHAPIENVRAMIFSAGLGTRFKPWTDSHPKALAVVNGKPLLQRNIEFLQSFGISDVVVNVHHFAEQVLEAIDTNKGWGSRISISNEENELLETGGGLLKAKDLLRGKTFVTINVDILTTLNLSAMVNFHRQQKNLATLAVAERKTTRFLVFNEDNRLCGWRNTNPPAEKIVVQADHYIQKAYSGIAVFETEILDLIPFTGKFSIIDVYLALAGSHRIAGFDHTGDKFLDVGKPDSVAKAEQMFV